MLVRMARSFFANSVKSAKLPTVSPKVINAAAWTHRNGLEISFVSLMVWDQLIERRKKSSGLCK